MLDSSASNILYSGISYAKEFFITEKGEVIKMGAMICKDPEIMERIKATKYTGKRKKRMSGEIQEHFISIYKIDNSFSLTGSVNLSKENQKASFTVIVFNTLDAET